MSTFRGLEFSAQARSVSGAVVTCRALGGAWGSTGAEERMSEQHERGQRTQAARRGSDMAGDCLRACEIDIADHLTVHVGHASVEYDGAWLDHVSGNGAGSANAAKEDVGLTCNGAQVECA